MDGLELTMKCSKLLKKPFLTHDIPPTSTTSNSSIVSNEDSIPSNNNNSSTNDINLSRTNLLAEDDRISNTSADISKTSRSGTTQSEMSQDRSNPPEEEKAITPYILAPPEEMGEVCRVKKIHILYRTKHAIFSLAMRPKQKMSPKKTNH